MGDADDAETTSDGAPGKRVRRLPPRWLAGSAIAIVVALGVAWTTREPIADYLVAGQFARLGLPATYRIESIGPQRQVLANVVIGDPTRPDLTIQRVIVETGVRGGIPVVVGLRLEHPRLAASLRGDRLSLGSLDALMRGPSTAPFRLPDLDLAIIDGQAVLAMDSGRAGAVITGSGPLRDGFSGHLGVSWPEARIGDCHVAKAVFAGNISVARERPRLAGPLRLARPDCGGATVDSARIGISADLAATMKEGEAELTFGSSAFVSGPVHVDRIHGKARLALKAGNLTSRYNLALAGIASPSAIAAGIEIDGVAHGGGATGLRAEGRIVGSHLAPGPAALRTLADTTRGAADTPAAALLAQLTRALVRESAGNRLAADYQLHRQGETLSLILPNARLAATNGETLLSLSRFGLGRDAAGRWRASGSMRTGGPGLPALNGQWSSDQAGTLRARLALAEYRAGASRLAIPALAITVRANGSVGFAGELTTSGPLPGGGSASKLTLPIVGDWSSRRGIAVWRACLPVRFASLSVSSLTLEQRGLTLCPPHGRPILARSSGGIRAAAGIQRLDLAGTLGGSPVTISGGPVGFAWPGRLVAGTLAVALGAGPDTSRFALSGLSAALGTSRDGAIVGALSGGDVRLAAVPLDVTSISGPWRYANGRLDLTAIAFRVSDRDLTNPRFNPLTARDATLSLADSRVSAQADLREPLSDRPVVHIDLSHNLANAMGHARLTVPSLTFDKAVQPDTLTPLALGVVANAAGTVRGGGDIEWNSAGVASTGRFATDSLDLAAAFGPAKGIAGTVEFTDLLGLVTAPHQTLRIASINPGIEANDGVLDFALLGGPNHVLAIEGGRWPFLDGRLELLPTRMTLGIAETRHYVLKVTGISAARFIERMDISNLAATGNFDGQLPLRFDQNGGWIEGGSLVSRPPGGSVSYVGELSYKNLSPMANFAFQTLRSLDYRRMTIGMDGPLAGELVTRVSMGGVTQGNGAKKNFLTRQLAKLPIRFDVNIRAPFFQLVSSFKSFYDPNYLADPRALGLIDAFGRPIAKPVAQPAIQPPASEHRP